VFHEGEFYIFGGETTDGAGATVNKVYDRVDIYNPTTNTWRLGASMPTPRHGIFPVLIAGRVYIAGGGTKAGGGFSSNKLEIYNPGPSATTRPPFVEQNGLVVMEGEHFHTAVPRTGKSWTPDTQQPGYVAESAMFVQPNNGGLTDNNYATTSPEMQYEVLFTTTGTYYLWARGWAANGNDNSLHMGLDNQAVATAAKMNLPTYGAWTWFNRQNTNVTATLVISTTGLHTINVWMREDGFRLDRLLLTTNAGFIPTGPGDPESGQTTPIPSTATAIAPTVISTAIPPTLTSTAIAPPLTSTAIAPTVTLTATMQTPTATNAVTATTTVPTVMPATPTATAPITGTATVTTPTATVTTPTATTPTAITPTVTGTVTITGNKLYLPMIIR